MPDRLSSGPAVLGRVLAIVLGFAAAGALAGVAWEALWEAPTGVAYRQRFLEPGGPDLLFSGTGLYVVLALPAGFVLGGLAGLVPRHETVTLVSVVLGSLLAGWLMYAVGHGLGPPDPRVLAAGAPDYTEVRGDLVLVATGDSTSPFRSTAILAFPVGALAGLALLYLSGFTARPRG